MSKLIVLRGPAASGKSTVANELASQSGCNVALLDFDVYRSTFLGKKGDYYPVAAKMLAGDAPIALEAGYDVVIDGFYRMENYPNFLADVFKVHPDDNYMFHFNVSLEETMRRHSRRPKAKDFGAKELKEWYYAPKPVDEYGFEYEVTQSLSVKEAVEYIRDITKLY